jgi:hypothetical protein
MQNEAKSNKGRNKRIVKLLKGRKERIVKLQIGATNEEDNHAGTD